MEEEIQETKMKAPSLQQDNTFQYERKKEQIYWNLYALNNVCSLSEMLTHYRYPSQYTLRDHDWRDLYFLNKQSIKGEKSRDTFLSRSERYFQTDKVIKDRILWLKKEQLDLKIIKYDFWSKIYELRPKTKSQSQSKKIVSTAIWQQRFTIFPFVGGFTFVFNFATGIYRMSLGKRLIITGLCFIIGQLVVRYKLSDNIFYKIPKLPDPQFQQERKQILNECLFFDGMINKYGVTENMDLQIFKLLPKQKSEADQIKLLECLNFNVITEQNL